MFPYIICFLLSNISVFSSVPVWRISSKSSKTQNHLNNVVFSPLSLLFVSVCAFRGDPVWDFIKTPLLIKSNWPQLESNQEQKPLRESGEMRNTWAEKVRTRRSMWFFRIFFWIYLQTFLKYSFCSVNMDFWVQINKEKVNLNG